jgi:hypothetical protein
MTGGWFKNHDEGPKWNVQLGYFMAIKFGKHGFLVRSSIDTTDCWLTKHYTTGWRDCLVLDYVRISGDAITPVLHASWRFLKQWNWNSMLTDLYSRRRWIGFHVFRRLSQGLQLPFYILEDPSCAVEPAWMWRWTESFLWVLGKRTPFVRPLVSHFIFACVN